MKKHSLAKMFFGIVFFFSLFLFLFSAYNIYLSNNITKNVLTEWDKRMSEDNGIKKTPVDMTEIEISVIDDYKFNNNKNPETEQVRRKLYDTRPSKGELIGKIIIPSINKELPIIEGTDQAELAKGVGHFIDSVLPGEKDNVVLAGHRDTVFRGLGDVKIGDLAEIETSAGTFVYQIEKQRIVESDDRTVIVPYEDAVLTLVTCYPFDYVGNAPQRYILVGKLVDDLSLSTNE